MRKPLDYRSEEQKAQAASLEEAKAKIEKIVKAAYRKIDNAIDPDRSATTERAKFTADVSAELLKKSIADMQDELFKLLNETESWEDLQANTEKAAKYEQLMTQLEQRSETIMAYLDNLSEADGRMTAQELAKLGSEAKKMQEALNKADPILHAALNWALGISDGKALDDESAVKNHFTAFKTYLSNGSDEGKASYLALSFLSEERRNQFAKFYVSDVADPAEKLKALENLNAHGALSPDGMKKILGEATIKPEKLKEYEMRWQETHYYSDMVKALGRDNYGAKNEAMEMLSLKNLAGDYVYGMMGIIILANVIASWGNKASLLKNPYFLGSIAGIKTLSLYRNGSSISEFLQSKSKTEHAEEIRSQEFILSMPPALRKLMEEQKGVIIVNEYITASMKDKTKLPKQAYGTKNFLAFLAARPEYKSFADSFKTHLTQNSITESEFENLITCFESLGISGDNVVKNYYAAIEEAKKKS